MGAIGIAAVSVGYNMMRMPDEAKAPAAPSPLMDNRANDPEAVIRGLQDRVGANPNDAEGWQRLGWAYFESGRHADAVRAYRHATKLAPGNATFWSSLGEAAVMASERDPMPKEAADAFDKAISLDPKDPRARYFLAVRRDLAKDHEGAIRDWLALLGDTPPGAPWEADLRRTIEQVGKINGIDVAGRLAAVKPVAPHPPMGDGMSVAAAAIPGPSREQMQAAAQLPKGQQDAMVEGMVSGLEAKLKANPGNVDGWIMLMRSRMTLGETAKAAAAYAAAKAANPAQAGRIRDEARILGVPGV
ncbi:tetratricopeptide repeat protein [Sphingobium sp. JS3065]|uniref:tetratricopeptide repeat protein n=1 Tax=Sphingobium sp. JS3065 TaxID=2970925 RepID=UPI00226496D9|nr:tetratricopeptide repeat protein [Sphingobium sp. JS3065]UZW57830.1 tetratricopeptide repeat protein [Sphingobium sp. JS3065]